MKYIESLSPETVKMLERIYRQSEHHQVRQRAHCILMSFQGFTMTQLMALFMVSRKTVFNWFQSWERHKLIGLYNEPGRGRKPLFSLEQQAQIREWVKAEPRNLKKVLAQIQETWDITASLETIKRVLKSVGMSWRRIRKRVAGRPDAVEYATQVAALGVLKDLDAAGEIDLRYADEAGFSLVPVVPYAWQDKRDGIEVPSQRSPQLNVLGLLNRQNQLEAYTFVGSITAAVVIAVLEQFSQTLKQRTVVVLDRASIHTSQAVDAMRTEWAERQLEIFWLPAYSPQLNLIEILWRFIKYQWLEFSAYKDWNSLVEAVENILKEVGKKYVINFA
jgi:transposase